MEKQRACSREPDCHCGSWRLSGRTRSFSSSKCLTCLAVYLRLYPESSRTDAPDYWCLFLLCVKILYVVFDFPGGFCAY